MKLQLLKNIFYISLLYLLTSSCSSINLDSREYYQKKHMRHGIVPIASNDVNNKRHLNPESILRGKESFMKNCFSCHGENARGNGPKSRDFIGIPRDLVAMVKEVPNFRFYVMASKIEGKMPGWKSLLSDKELVDIENFIIDLALKE